ncbi:hypothetical protein H7849_11970 [Alloacidobacterium dinghuense]|uniref:Major tropism determinant N-terminal domain-containing protein n=1 Tax=Alloacidobacterium dinghuense TaxID=2763107 RepID=A0A7G8BPS3_9BACT|nr:hypothetical protein [Alloacidobacterium dinghuense]QNI34543.1 hypothetical protein H7849_11970 [Alloacidobacterium dinghuense]
MSTLASVIEKGLYSALPAASIPGRLYFATDTEQIWRDNGTSWDNVTPAGASAITALTGDVTATGPGSAAATLAASGVTAGTYNNPTVTFDVKGRATAAINGYFADSGSANAYAVTISPAPSLVAGFGFQMKAAHANTGASTVSINGGTAINITKAGTTALTGGEIAAGQIIELAYDGTEFQIIGGSGSGGGGVTQIIAGTNVTISPSGGTGAVTIDAGGGGGGGNLYGPVDAQTGTSYTLQLSDAPNGLGTVTMNNAANNTVTVPPNSSVNYPVGTVLEFVQLGAGQTALAAGAGVTINTPTSLSCRAQYSTIAIKQIATNVWVAEGDLQ